jgi:hypothetical protein
MKHRCNEIGSGSFLKAHPQVVHDESNTQLVLRTDGTDVNA